MAIVSFLHACFALCVSLSLELRGKEQIFLFAAKAVAGGGIGGDQVLWEDQGGERELEHEGVDDGEHDEGEERG